LITWDSDRSRKRVWFAKKKLAQITNMNNPAGGVNFGGFKLTYWQSNGLSGGRVVAPMGLAVLKSNAEGISVVVADSWTDGIDSKVPLSLMLIGDAPASGTIEKLNNMETAAKQSANSTIVFVPKDVTWAVGGHSQVCKHPQPKLMPYAEGFWVTASGYADADYRLTLVESFFNFYSADGSTLSGRLGFAANTLGTIQNLRVLWNSPAPRKGTRYLQIVYGYQEISEDGDIICGTLFSTDPRTGPSKNFYTGNEMWGDIPAGLFSVLTSLVNNGLGDNMGGYAYALSENDPIVYFHFVDATQLGPANDWFTANPGNNEWKLFYTIYDGTTVYTVDSDQFVVLLDSLCSSTIISGSTVNYSLAMSMLRQLCPWPNVNPVAPYDGAMFHDADGIIYSWTREYGAVQFTTTGLFTKTLFLPTDVTGTDGVRPELTHVGNSQYLLVCNQVGVKIVSLYYGTPFTGSSWTQIEDVPDGYYLRYVRPVRVDLSGDSPDIVLLAVARKEAAGDNPDADYCFFYNGSWNQLTKIPGEPDGSEQYDLSLFGVGGEVKHIQDFVSPPHVHPQMPVASDYSYYSAGMP